MLPRKLGPARGGDARVLAMIGRAFGATLPSRLGSGMVLAGLALIGYSAAAYVGLAPGGYATVPEPVALSATGQRAARLEAAVPAATSAPAAPVQAALSEAAPTVAASPAPPPAVEVGQEDRGDALSPALSQGEMGSSVSAGSTQGEGAGPAIKMEPADAGDRLAAALAPRPGLPLRLVLPSIKVDTEVKVGGLVEGKDGELEWETLPFVATTYPVLGLVGAPGNAVVSGHVVTLREGNVFRDLYRVELGEQIEVYTADSHFTYRVEEIKLVLPEAVEVLAPSEEARLTIITCGGTFDARSRTFSDRLVVVGRLVGGERL